MEVGAADESTLRFRQVLPHEPQPKDEGLGYLYLRGIFCPKVKRHDDDENLNCEEGCWTKEILLARVTSLFCSKERSGALGLPFAACRAVVLNAEPPLTKLFLTYKSQLQAFHSLIALKRLKLTPADIFTNESEDATFSCKQIHVAQSTFMEHPESAWTRPGPPKFRRLLANRPGEDETHLKEERERTRYVFMSGLISNDDPADSTAYWDNPHCVAEAIRRVVAEYDSSGLGPEVFVSARKSAKYCHLGMRSAEDARRIIAALQEQQVDWIWTDASGQQHTVRSGTLFLDYAAITHRSVTLAQSRRPDGKGEVARSDCTSTTAHEVVPGLVIVEDFVSEQEEAALMAVLNGPQTPWAPAQSTPTEGGVVKRRVQHFGYVFDYKTADVLRDRTKAGADCPPMPKVPDEGKREIEMFLATSLTEGQGWDVLAGISERVRTRGFVTDEGVEKRYPFINQMTVNHYVPGEGIGSHVDTPSAFGDGLMSLSLNSGIVMEFRKDECAGGDRRRKLVYLPRRSLVLMSGEARYNWEHMIVNRMTDTHGGEVLARGLRVSCTFRTALDVNGGPLPLVESDSYPPVWGASRPKVSPLRTPECEKNHVHQVYDSIATQWHNSRGRRGVLWPGATLFLQKLPKSSVVADVGCGDGKYFPAIWEADSYVIGTDVSLPLLKTARPTSTASESVPESRRVSPHRHHLRDRPAVAVADCLNIPIKTSSCDAAVCIAVMHHLSTEERRQRCIEELARIVRPGGLINIQAWAITQEEGSRRSFAATDVFVPFNAQPRHLKMGTVADKNDQSIDDKSKADRKSTAHVYAKALNAEYDDKKGLVVFQRYCHMYRRGELDAIAARVPGVELVDSGFECGNYFVILRVIE